MNKITIGIIVGLVVGLLANPLMPPAFFVVGGLIIWWTLGRPKSPGTDQPSDPRRSGQDQ